VGPERDHRQPPPPPDPAITRLVYRGPYAVAPQPPPSPAALFIAAQPPVRDEVKAIPTGIRALVGASLDLLFRRDAGLRSPSFYIGFMLLVTLGPLAAMLGMQVALGNALLEVDVAPTPLDPWIALAALPAILGYLVASVESRTLATAVTAARMEGRPIALPESVGIARRRFWRMFAAQFVVTFLTLVIATVLTVVVDVALLEVGPIGLIDVGISLVVGVAVAWPFVYVPAGLVLGEVGVAEAISRSIRLARLRGRLALVLALFASAPQILVGVGIGTGLDIVIRLAGGPEALDTFPLPLVIPAAAILSFAFGTLVFLSEAVAASPAVHAFASLTHYTHGLEIGREKPVDVRRPWAPWMTPGLAAGAVIAVLSLVGGIQAIG
jgi:hypothetical protein